MGTAEAVPSFALGRIFQLEQNVSCVAVSHQSCNQSLGCLALVLGCEAFNAAGHGVVLSGEADGDVSTDVLCLDRNVDQVVVAQVSFQIGNCGSAITVIFA